MNNTASSGGGFWIDLAPWTGAHLKNVVVTGNHGYSGGGITLWNNIEPVFIENAIITGNSATTLGGGIHASGTTYYVKHSLIANNTSQGGGAIYHAPPDAWTDPCPCPQTTTDGTVEFSVLANNSASNGGSGVWTAIEGLTVQDSIVFGNGGTAVKANSPLTWRYNDTLPATFTGMSDPTGSNGNLSSDPHFVDAASADYHLANGSVCINAADPQMADPDGSRADMGMFGGMP
jgi:predicted outer membrane repeat protein